MSESGFSLFLWMTMGFTFLYVVVLSALTAQPKNQPIIVTTVRDVHRRKRKRTLLIANAAVPIDRPRDVEDSADLSGEPPGTTAT